MVGHCCIPLLHLKKMKDEAGVSFSVVLISPSNTSSPFCCLFSWQQAQDSGVNQGWSSDWRDLLSDVPNTRIH